MTGAVFSVGLRGACFGQLQLALMLLLQDGGQAYLLAPQTSPVHFNGPVCPTGCSSCSTLNGCATCRTNYILFVHWQAMRQIGNCIRACPTEYFAVMTRKGEKCIKCGNHRCAQCTNSTSCTRCHPPFALHNGQCLIECPPEQPHYIETSGQCVSQLDCQVDQWSSWRKCKRNGEPVCGSKRGRQRRQRHIIQHPTARGQQCPVTVEFRKCRMKFRSCEDSTVTDNTSGHVTKSRNRSTRRKWLQLALKNRKRKLKKRPMDERSDVSNRKKHIGGDAGQAKPSFHRRRIDVNLIEAREK